MEGAVGGEAPAVHSVGLVDGDSGPAGWMSGNRSEGLTVLLTSSPRAVCREFDVPVLSDAETRSMLQLRLEAELPYELAKATWAWTRLRDSAHEDGASVLCLAMPSDDFAAGEQELTGANSSPEFVECREAALAQLGASATSSGTVAVAEIAKDHATVVVVRRGKLHYARTLSTAREPDLPSNGGLRNLARELRQTIQHYALTRKAVGPQELLLVGAPDSVEEVRDAFAETRGLSVRVTAFPEEVNAAELEVPEEEVAAEFGSCLGALIAAHRRLTGAETAAPGLRSRANRARKQFVSRRVALMGLSVILLVGTVWVAFAARKARLHAAEGALENSGSLLRRIEVLEEETDILQRENQRIPSTLDLLRAMSEALPKGIDVSDLTIESNGSVTLMGRAPSIEVASRGATALSDAKQFTGARLERTSTEKGKVTFRITCTVAGRGG